MPRINIPLVGPSSHAGSDAQQTARTVNFIPVPNDADAKGPMGLMHAAGTSLAVLVSGEFPVGTDIRIRGFHRVGHNRLFFVANEKVFEAIDLEAGTFTLWATLPTTTDPLQVGMSDNNGWLILGDNSYWGINLALGAGVATLDPVLNDESEQILGWYPRWIDGITLYPERNDDQFRYSDLGAPMSVNGLDFMTAEGDPDNINQLIIAGREAVFLGGRSTEVFAFTGDSDNRFQRIGGGFTPYGISCRYSAAYCAGLVVFVGRHTNGEGQVVALGNAGSKEMRISTPAVEYDIAAVLAEDQQNRVTGFFREDRGRQLYHLNLPATTGSGLRPAAASKTWCFDFTTKLWHELAYLNTSTGQFERHKAEHHTLLLGKHYVSTYDDGAIYRLDQFIYSDVDAPLVKFRETAGPISMQGRRFKVNKVGVEMSVGVGRDGGVQGSDPQLMMQYRWGQGAWSNEIWRSIGQIGAGKTLVRFGPCGSGHDLTFRFSVSDPIPLMLTGAWADVDLAA